MILFSRQEDGSYKQAGECQTIHGRFQWLRDDGTWDGGWCIEELSTLLARMNRGGPYKYDQYRTLEAEKPELVIKPTCAGCGVIAGVDCQRACEYLFGRADVTESLPIQFNEDHQFNLSIAVVTEGKNFGNKKPKTFWFNSVRCAELLLMENGHCKDSDAVIGSGERLLAYLGGPEIVKARKKRAPNKSYLERLAVDGQIPVLASKWVIDSKELPQTYLGHFLQSGAATHPVKATP